MSEAGCPCCGCRAAGGERAHAIAAALRDDDLDRAMTLGLLDGDNVPAACAACAPDCRARIEAARAARMAALAARERHRARALRLARRERERAERRTIAPVAPVTSADIARDGTEPAPAAVSGLPPAAAAALARARARAAGKPA